MGGYFQEFKSLSGASLQIPYIRPVKPTSYKELKFQMIFNDLKIKISIPLIFPVCKEKSENEIKWNNKYQLNRINQNPKWKPYYLSDCVQCFKHNNFTI